jgi:hypothetical protein
MEAQRPAGAVAAAAGLAQHLAGVAHLAKPIAQLALRERHAEMQADRPEDGAQQVGHRGRNW